MALLNYQGMGPLSIDVVVLTYNRVHLVQRAIRSILNASDRGLEIRIIVVDDGSTDGTRDGLEHFGDLIQYHRLDNNGGPGAASKFALELVKAPFFVRVDSDDFVSRHFFTSLVPVMHSNPSYAICSCNFLLVDDLENPLSIIDLGDDASLIDYGAGMVFRTEIVKQAGGYDASLRFREDMDLHLKLRERHVRRYHYPVPLYKRRLHSQNTSADPNHQRMKEILNGE